MASAGGGGGEGVCLPDCYCERCLPLRMQTLEALPFSEQRAFWSRVRAAGGQHLHQLFPPPPPPPLRPPGVAGLLPGLSASTQARARWNIPHHVLENVPNISDAFEFIDAHLETHAGPRRKQCMMEAMQKVIDTYSEMFRPISPTTVAENVQSPIVVSIDGARVSDFNESLQSDAQAQECTICGLEFENGDQCATLACNHMFHKWCIDRWALEKQQSSKGSCPNCRDAFFIKFHAGSS